MHLQNLHRSINTLTSEYVRSLLELDMKFVEVLTGLLLVYMNMHEFVSSLNDCSNIAIWIVALGYVLFLIRFARLFFLFRHDSF